jgi:hypothetical protein
LNLRNINRFAMMILVAVIAVVSGQGLQVKKPYIQGFHPLDEEAEEYSMLKSPHPVLMNLTSRIFIDTSRIDFEKRQITFKRTDPLGYTLWEYHYPELSDFLSERRNYSFGRAWKKSSISNLTSENQKSKQNVAKLQWELPVQYPSWAQRVLGNEPPRLTIDGNLKLTIAILSSLSNSPGTSSSRVNDFQLDEDYNFSVTGSVGRLINVSIRSSSEENFNFSDNFDNFKIEYKEVTPGELEDEIIQEVVAGYTGFDMKGTSLTGIIDSKQGLFGIKVRAKLGPLMLTTIAATEHAENGSRTFSRGGGSSSSSMEKVSKFLENVFFYLDNNYRQAYIKRYAKNGTGVSSVSPVDSLEVWVKADKIASSNHMYYTSDDSVYLTETDTSFLTADSIKKTQRSKFLKLKENVHYKLTKEDGYIQFTDSIKILSTDLVAIYMRSRDGSIKKGEYRIDGTDTLRVLWPLKPAAYIDVPAEDPARYFLMWRNVYSIPQNENLMNLKVSIKKKNADNSDTSSKTTMSPARYYSEVVGIANDKGNALIQDGSIFRGKEGLLVIPPWDTSAYGDLPFMNTALGADVDSSIYLMSAQKRVTDNTTLYIEGGNTTVSPILDLNAFDVLEGTDKVWANGDALERNVDYVINYDDGTIELISLKAKMASDIKAEFQEQSMFAPQKKVFLGMNGQVQLPFLSDKSFVAGTLLYQDVKVSENVPRLGQEGYGKLLFDLNTVIDLEPEWMTSLVNKIPLIETTTSSQVKFELEVAHSSMNANPDGKAYVDDFEDSKSSDNFGNDDDEWYQASPPQAIIDSLSFAPPVWDFYWFTPIEYDNVNRIRKTDLYFFEPNAKASATDGYVSAVRFHCTPAPSDSTLKDRYKKAWAGVMTPVPSLFANKEKMQYIDFYVKDQSVGKPGKLLLQFGQMKEDISLDGGLPNKSANKEDTAATRSDYKFYLESLDLGIDSLKDSSEVWSVPDGRGGWTTLGFNHPQLGIFRNDPAHDNGGLYDKEHPGNYRLKSRTQNNKTIFDGEDINHNSTVETATKENYFQFELDLSDTTAPYFETTEKLANNTKWRKVHLPIKEILPGWTQYGSPQWKNISMIRMIWTGFDSSKLTSEHQLIVSDMKFVGNQWISAKDSSGSKIEALSISNKESKNYKIPPGFKVEIDASTKDTIEEKALQLTFKNLRRGKEAIVVKNYDYQVLNLTAYKNLSMYVYGDNTTSNSNPLYNGGVKFVFRFGSDSSTYYEYRKPIYQGWDSNFINIDLQKLARAKDLYMVHNPDSAIKDTGDDYSVVAPKGRQPNLSQIKWMALGVVRDTQTTGADADSGFIWIDEMILSGIDKIGGWAARSELSMKFADFLNFKTDMTYTNGNYRKIQDLTRTPNNSDVKTNVNASVNIDRFLPKDYGVSIPIGVVLQGSANRPQLKNSDVPLGNQGKADNLSDLAGDAVGMMLKGKPDNNYTKETELYENQTSTRNFYTSYSKASPSDFWLSNMLADRINTSFTYSTSVADSSMGYNPSGTQVYKRKVESDVYSYNLKYDLSQRSDKLKWTKFRPHKTDSSAKWIPERLWDYELSLLPSTLNFTLGDASLSDNSSFDTKKNTSDSKRSLTVKHGFQMDYAPVSPLLKLNYSLNVDRNLDTVVVNGIDKEEMLSNIFARHKDSRWKDLYILRGERSRNQNAGIKFDPQFFNWLTTSADYNSNFTSSWAQMQYDKYQNDYFNMNVNSTFSVNSTLNFADLISLFTANRKPNSNDSGMIRFENGFKKLGFRSVSFTYSAGSRLNNNNVEANVLDNNWTFFKYKLGVTNRNIFIGEMDDSRLGGMTSRIGHYAPDYYKNDKRTVNRSYKFSSGLDLTVPFELSFNPITIQWSSEYSLTPDTSLHDSSFTLPDISVSARTPALMKIGFISDIFRDLTLTSNYSFKKTEQSLNSVRNTTNRIDLSPLINLSGNIKKWPISLNYSHKYSKEKKKGEKILDTTTTNSDELTIGYEIEKSNRLNEIKILYWKIPVKGKTTLGMTMSRNSTINALNLDDNRKIKENLSLSPHLTYIFTDNVTGTLSYTGTRSKDGTENRKSNEKSFSTDNDNNFSLVIDIRFK